MTKEKAKKQSDIIKELRAHVEKQNVEIKDLKSNLEGADKLADELVRDNELVRGELQKAVIRAGAAEAKAAKIERTASDKMIQLDAVIHRARVVLAGMLEHLLDPESTRDIPARKFEKGWA